MINIKDILSNQNKKYLLVRNIKIDNKEKYSFSIVQAINDDVYIEFCIKTQLNDKSVVFLYKNEFATKIALNQISQQTIYDLEKDLELIQKLFEIDHFIIDNDNWLPWPDVQTKVCYLKKFDKNYMSQVIGTILSGLPDCEYCD